MRLKLGRPDLERHRGRFDVPRAQGDLGVTFLGVATLLFDDGDSAVMFDAFFSRPSLLKVALRPLTPNVDRIDAALHGVGFGDGRRRLDAIVPVHTHFDHAMDSAVVAARTGATVVGGGSAANVARGGGLGEDRIQVVADGEQATYGAFTLDFVDLGALPARPLPRHHRRAGRGAGQGGGVPLR